MGAGKSSVGRVLGSQLGWIFEDLDDRIERREKRKVWQIFRDTGESGFRRAEHAALKESLLEMRSGSAKVLALGGGAFGRKNNAALIRAAKVRTVFLDAEVRELWQRCRQQAEGHRVERPLLGSLESFAALYRTRRPLYLTASSRQETGGKTIPQIAAEVIQSLGLERCPGKRGKNW